MSTRSTLDHGDHHHLFIDFMESGVVNLTMRGTDFEARPGQVTVAIPLGVWNRMKQVEIPSDDWWDFPPSPILGGESPEQCDPEMGEEERV